MTLPSPGWQPEGTNKSKLVQKFSLAGITRSA
jgi:hypothetical protein